mgnify:CR=1 FL=1
MKRLAVVVMVAALALTGCARGLSDMAEARDECHEYGGVFESWKNEFGYHWECDLSDLSSGGSGS